jgi:ATP-dependent Clp protease ATP-binding subunit ClpC
MPEILSPAAQRAWDAAHHLAALRGSAAADPVHLVMALLAAAAGCPALHLPEAADLDPDLAELARLMAGSGLEPAVANRALAAQVERGAPIVGVAATSGRLQAVAAQAAALAGEGARTRPVHLLAACCSLPDGDPTGALLDRALLPRTAIRSASGASSVPRTPLLEELGRDLSARARLGKLPPTCGRRAEVTRIARVLMRTRAACPVLVGEPGIGRTSTVHRFVQRLGEIGPQGLPGLRDLRVVQLDPARLRAGGLPRAQQEKRLQALLDEVRQTREIVLFLDDLAESGPEEEPSLLAALAPALERGEVRVVATATPAAWAAVERQPALARSFEAIPLEEPSAEEAGAMVECFATGLETHPGFAGQVRIEREAIEAAVRISHRFLADGRLPDKACRLLESACHATLLVSLSRPMGFGPGGFRIGRKEVASVAAEALGQPAELLLEDDARRLLLLQSALSEQILGQDDAIAAVSSALRRAVALRPPDRPAARPLASFLFVGPTGVGKTQLARCLARALFGGDEALVALDMSGFKERHDVARLVGAPPGYRGHEEEQALGAAIRKHPFSVVLFDEIDKAHPEVLDALLPLLDEGRLVDARGQRYDFTHAVVVLTSNLGAEALTAARATPRVRPFGAPAAAPESGVEAMLGEVRRVLKPEILGRLTEVVVFRPLDLAALERIGEVVLAALLADLPPALRGTLVSPEARSHVVRQGARQGLGAREVRRALEREIIEPLVDRYMQGGFEGWKGLRAELRSGALCFERREG